MAFNEHSLKKEHRKQWRSIAKLVDKSCRNHGSCPWCQGNRQHNNKIHELTDIDYKKIKIEENLPIGGIIEHIEEEYYDT